MTRTTLTNTDRFFVLAVLFIVIAEFAFPQVVHGARTKTPLLLAQAWVRDQVRAYAVATTSQSRIQDDRADEASTMYVTVTSYSSTIDQTDDTPFITAWGTFVRDGVVAANFLPLGTRIRMPDHFGDRVFIVEDRMNERYWNRIDIWQPTREGAKQWGIKRVRVEIL